MTLDEILITPQEVSVNKSVYNRRINNASLAFSNKIKTGMRQRISSQEGDFTIDAIQTFWGAYGAVKEKLTSEAIALDGKKFIDLYSLYVAASYADEKCSSQVDDPKFYARLLDLRITGDEYLLIDDLMRNFIYETQNCTSGKMLARNTRGFFQRIQELARTQMSQDYEQSLEDFENNYLVRIGNSFSAQGTSVSTEDPEAGKPNEDVGWGDFGGYPEIKEEMQFLTFALTDPKMKEKGYIPPKGICFYGLSGTGKTLMAKILANECSMPFHYFNMGEMLSKWAGESEQNVQEQWSKPGAHFIDEADSLLGIDNGQNDSGLSLRLKNTWAEMVDGFKSRKDILFILSTNSIKLDRKVKRAGRIDDFYFFGFPGKEAIKHVYTIHTHKLQEGASVPIINGLDIDYVTDITHRASELANQRNPSAGIVPADCKNILDKTHNRMLRNYWKTKEFHPMGTEDVIETIKNYNLEERAE